ncbi:hypothetical protein J7384_17685 [Endozoicomonas sp. G2_1]|uniref:hypothetical protein n=1 Tax=Endozoicomonas sp. G2_1 TaxID=2821091 RepID=UPI001AD97573|nr:hypothetical protein [Endozoicomonas sp. G2_1]MBO9492197.1 hypothetical protein [Endozoicomonas sp. G2_1]
MNKLLAITILFIFVNVAHASDGSTALYKLCKSNNNSCDLIIQSYISGLKAGLNQGSKETIKHLLSQANENNKEIDKILEQTPKFITSVALGGGALCQIALNRENMKKAFVRYMESQETPETSVSKSLLTAFIQLNNEQCQGLRT